MKICFRERAIETMSTDENHTRNGLQIMKSLPHLKKHSKTEKILCLVTVACLLAVAVMTAVLIGYHNKYNLGSKQMDSSNVCLTPGCVNAASQLLSRMDNSVDPCDDFYQFACGGWLKTRHIPDDKSRLDGYAEAQDILDLQLRNLMEMELNGTEPRFIKMTKDLYDMCMDTKNIEEAGAEPLKNVLKSLGGWPVVEGENWNENKFDWLEILLSLREMGYLIPIPLRISVATDAKNNTRNILELDETSLGIERDYLVRGLNDSVTSAYFKKMVKAATLLGAKESTAEKELLEVLELEMILANYSLPLEEKRDFSKFYNIYTVKALQEMVPQIPWRKYISGILMDQFDEDETVNVRVPEFVKKVADLITKTKKRVIANYLLWGVIHSSLELLSKDWRELDLEFQRVLLGKSEDTPRWNKCIFSTLEVGVNSYYIRYHFHDTTKEEVSEVVNYVYRAFLSILDEIDWMDEKTRTHAKAKANNMKFQIGYPKELLNNTAVMEYLQNLTISKGSYFENMRRVDKWITDRDFSKLRKPNKRLDWRGLTAVAVINAFYDPYDNVIILPAGYIQDPFFSKDRPNYLNFAAIGETIGHEITHGFDDQGRQYDKDGNNVNWWEEVTDENFRKKTQCIIDQYSNYTIITGKHLNGVITQSENIADNGGIKESYLAYQSWVKDHGEEQLLPGLEYTQNQLFWIASAAFEYCAKDRPESLNDDILSEPHSPGEFRVIGPLSNLVEFAKDFNCPPHSRMNKQPKCEVW